MNRKRANFIVVALAGVGIAFWYISLEFISIVWLWLLVGVPRQLAMTEM